MNIKIKSLKIDDLYEKSLSQDYLYKDTSFDFFQGISYNNNLNKSSVLEDVQPIYDENSVKNSIKTAFLTSPGDKILNPTYGIDLRRYLFEPVDKFTEDIIREDILDNLPIMEPRITINDIYVKGDPDNNQYDISMRIDVPSLRIYGLSIKSLLNSSGYSIV